MTKVLVSKEVAEAIEYLRSKYEVYQDNSFFIEAHAIHRSDSTDASWFDRPVLNRISTEVFASAIINGYEIEKSPEDKVREYYEGITKLVDKFSEAYDNGALQSVRHTLDLLGIKIEGVND